MASVFKLKYRGGKLSNRYYGKIGIAPGVWKRVKLFVDSDASKRELRRLQTEVDQKGVGVIDQRQHSRTPILDHVEAYFGWMRIQGYDANHIAVAKSVLNRLIEKAGWKVLGDITPANVDAVLPVLAKTQAYRNQFVKRAKAFASWLRASRRSSTHLLASLRRKSERGCARNRARRAATPQQYISLLQSEIPDDRRLAYALACLNGLRRNEVGRLTWNRVHLMAPIPFMELLQKNSDNDTLDSIPIHPYVAMLLRQRTPGMPGVRLIRFVPDVATLKRDWERVGVEMIDERKLRIDFHGLRHAFTTALDMAGVSRATKKRLTRHAAEDVTDGYAHAELADMASALARLHSPINPPHPPEAILMTGTSNLPMLGAVQGLHHPSGLLGQNLASSGGATLAVSPVEAVNSPTEKTTISLANVAELRYVASSDLNATHRAANVTKVRPDARVD